MERNAQLIKSKFLKYLIPGILMTAALQIGNLVDSVFVGNFIGADALSAINIAMPVILGIQVVIFIFAVGGSIISAICLGKRENENASAVFSATFLIVIAACVVNAVASVFYCRPLAQALSGTGELADLSCKYMSITLLGMPLMAVGLFLSYYMGVDNHPNESAALHITANIINLVTDFIFIKLMGMGIAGSALSTVVGYGAAGIVFGLKYAFSKKRMLRFDLRGIGKCGKLLRDAAESGASSGLMLAFSALKILVLNSIVLYFIGDTGMAMYAICTNSLMILQLCLHGVTGVIQTTCGILYGDHDYFGVRYILRSVIRISIVISIALMVVFLAAPGFICAIFGFDQPALNAEMHRILQVYAISFLFYAFNNIAQAYYSCVEQPFMATFDTLMQGLVILIPVTLIIIIPFGVIGTSVGSVVAEAGAILLVQLLRKARQKNGSVPGQSYDVLPRTDDTEYFDITVKGEEQNASEIAHSVQDFCIAQGIGERSANILAIASEEIIDNIVRYGAGERRSIDLRLFRNGETIVFRIRDDGPAFNPVEYVAQKELEGQDGNGDEFSEIGGLMLIRKLAQKIDYSYVMNMNNTIVEVPGEIR